MEPFKVALFFVGVAQVQVEGAKAKELAKVPGDVHIVQMELGHLVNSFK